MGRTLQRSDWQELIKKYAEVTGNPGIYVLGCFARHVTLYSQQVRAFNLVYGLHETGKLKQGTRVAVVGAGAAGLAAASALSHLQCDVTLFEQNEEVLSLQANSTHRWLHPRIYDWPVQGFYDTEARLPFCDWKAANADEVVSQIKKSWTTILAYGRVKPHFSVKILDLSRNSAAKAYRLKWEQNGAGLAHADFERIIMALGFGLESETKSSESYWSPENLDDHFHPKWKYQRWLISGFGDGAFADLMRVCIKSFRYTDILHELESAKGIGGIKAELERIHADRTLSNENLSNQFYNLSTSSAATRLEEKLVPYLKQQGPKVFLTGISPHIYGRGSSILNRLIVLLLSRLGAFTHIPGPSGAITPFGDHYQVQFPYPASLEIFDRVIVRHGTSPVIQDFAKHQLGNNSCKKLQTAWSTVLPDTDLSRLPHWPPDFFGVPTHVPASVALPGSASGSSASAPSPAPSQRDSTFEDTVRHFGVKISQFSSFKEIRGDGGSTVTYAIEGLTSVDKPITGMHFHFESYAGKIGLPVLDPSSARLGIYWKPDVPPPDGSQSMENLRAIVCRASGTVVFRKPHGPSDPPLTFSLQITVLNGDALTAWEYNQLYEPKAQEHVDRKRMSAPIEYFSRFVWCPVETLKLQVTLPSSAIKPVTASIFSLPSETPIEPGEVLQDSIVHLYPQPDSPWDPSGGDWERQKDKAYMEAINLASPSSQTWVLTVKKPPVGTSYSLDWKMPESIAQPETLHIAREARELRARLLKYGRSHGVNDGFPAPQKRAIRRLLVRLHQEIDTLQRNLSFADPFDIELMTYDDENRQLRLVDEVLDGKAVRRPKDLWFPFGLGLAGACFKQGDAPFFYYRKLVDEKRLGPEYYLNTRLTKPHKGMVSLPLVHPGWYGPAPGETIEPGRLCVGVVDIGFESEPRWLNALRTANDFEVVKLRAAYQNFCDQLCVQLGAI